MEYEEIVKRAYEFAEYLDNMEPGRKKEELGRYFKGYNELIKKYLKEKYRRIRNEAETKTQ